MARHLCVFWVLGADVGNLCLFLLFSYFCLFMCFMHAHVYTAQRWLLSWCVFVSPFFLQLSRFYVFTVRPPPTLNEQKIIIGRCWHNTRPEAFFNDRPSTLENLKNFTINPRSFFKRKFWKCPEFALVAKRMWVVIVYCFVPRVRHDLRNCHLQRLSLQVYFAEEKIALGKSYHKMCFACGNDL